MADADLVLEGGGVKGIAHIGALSTLESNGYTFHRVAGTSAGSIAAAFTAGCMKAGRKVSDIEPLLFPGKSPDSIDYGKVPGGKLPIPIVEPIREVASLVLHKGIFSGDYLRDWIHKTLKKETGVETFKDLKLDDGRGDLSIDQQYSLVVMVADISRGSLIRLPWDYHLYNLDPDQMFVADAVRASASIPFFFEPFQLHWGAPSTNVSYLVDGGACSDFPIEIFDRLDNLEPRWPTFGIKLSAEPVAGSLINHVHNPVTFTSALLETVINGNDQVHLADPCVVERTLFVDMAGVASVNFELTPDQQNLLFGNGQAAATKFLGSWDWNSYKGRCADDPARIARARAARGEFSIAVAPS
jgi:NTE family protein